MRYNSLILEKKDSAMILRHRYSSHHIEDYSHLDALQRLEENMAQAQVYNLQDMPEDIRLAENFSGNAALRTRYQTK